MDYWNIPYGDLITYFYGGIQNYAGEFGDFLPKPNFEKSNKPADGKNVLLYLNNSLPPKDSNGNDIDYYLTDDLSLFDELNEGNGCWISTLSETDANGNTIAKKLGNYFPRFTRYQTVGEKVKSSLDFGTPQEIYTNQVMDDSVNIYNRYWKSYITDMYDDDTRIVTVPMFINDMKLPIEMLRKFYYFDGCYWILNQIIDYNVSVKGMTKCVFVKINDMNNYR